MYRDMNSKLDVNESIRPAVLTADTNGESVDLRGAQSATVCVSVGATAGTMTTSTVTLEESDDDATFTDVADADILGAEPTLTTDTAFQFGYIGGARYVRAVYTEGAATSCALGVMIVRGNLDRSPSEAPRSNALA